MRLITSFRMMLVAAICCLIAHTPAHAQGNAPTGACCVTNAAGVTTCTVVRHNACNRVRGQYQGNGIACAPNNTCPQRGACCFATGRCIVAFQQRCAAAGATFQTPGSTCRPNTCPQPPRGACCITHDIRADCVVLTAARCTAAHGTYQGDASACTATLCPQPVVGACCIAATATSGPRCAIGTAARCAAAGGRYGGDDSTCRSANCPTTCLCDWDHSGLLGVHDWFAFLNDWLAGHGDFNGDGTTDRQDVLDFRACFDAAPPGCVRVPHDHDDDDD